MAQNKLAKGEGSVYFRASDQRWCGTLTLPSPDGKRRRKTVTGSSEKDALQKLAKMRGELAKQGDLPTDNQTFASWLNVWFTTIAIKKIRPKTVASYRTLLQQHIIPTIGKVPLVKLTPAHIRSVEEEITSTLKNPKKPELGFLKSTTAMQAHRIMAVALKYAEREGRVTRNVANLTDAPRRSKKSLVILTAEDGVKVLRTVAGDAANGIEPDRLASRWAAALLTGARQGELLGLELDRVTDDLDLSWQLQRVAWEHGCKTPCGRKRGAECPDRKITSPADWEHRHLTGGLYLSRPKSEAGTRIVPLVDPLRSILQVRIAEAATEPNPHGLLWTAANGKPIDPSRDNKEWHSVLSRAGVPDARLHDARHTTASLLRKAGVPIELITKILGHSTYAMSREYIDVDREQLSDAMSRMSALMQ